MTEHPDKLDLHSQDISEEKKQELLRLFPEIHTEGGKIDLERLKLLIGETVDVGKECYGMNWPGKADCFKTIQAPSMGTLRPCPEESINFDTTENLIIEGDNLEVLKLLQKSYLGKIKMIYIDPPYNTGKEFIYPDNYTESLQTYLQYTGQVDSEGKKFSTNTEADGRFHSKWMNMMYPRLYLARNLLRDDGVIFISIDDNEVSNLRKLCDEIFGEENFEGHIHWRRRHNQPNDSTKMIGLVAEHIISYSKNKELFKQNGVGKIDLTGDFSNPDNDPRGDWASKPWKVGSDQSGSRYKIINPNNSVRYDEEWMGDENTYKKLLTDNRIIFPRKGDGLPRKKYFRFEREEEGQCATNWWTHEQFGHNQGANDEMANLFNGIKNIFSNPKPKELLRGLIQISNSRESDFILDFFAGSGTTAHAVLDLNNQDGGNRKIILVQLPELCDKDSEAFKAGFKTISEITKERVRRVIKKFNEEDENKSPELFSNLKQIDLVKKQDNLLSKLLILRSRVSEEKKKADRGFRVFKLTESNFKTWNADIAKGNVAALEKQLELHIDHIRPERSQEDILYEILLKSGFALTPPIEKLELAGMIVFSAAGGTFLICLERKLTMSVIEAMAKLKPGRVVCLDEGFTGNDQLKANAVQIFKTKGVNFKTV